MPAEALALVLSAAVIHAVWNTLLAGSRDPQVFGAVVLIVGALVGAPAAVFFWDVDAAVWPFVAATSALELTYFILLAYAYTRAELSVVYPLARGLAPILVLIGAVAFTGAGTSPRQIAGVLLVGGGIVLVRGVRRGRGALLAVGIACTIAAYTVVDKHGVRHASPVAYLELMSIFTGLGYAIFISRLRGPTALRVAFDWKSLLAGAGMFAAYACVLAALRLASAASVAAVRESSVLVATALGAVVLHERVTVWRCAGAALVVSGVVLLSL